MTRFAYATNQTEETGNPTTATDTTHLLSWKHSTLGGRSDIASWSGPLGIDRAGPRARAAHQAERHFGRIPDLRLDNWAR